MPYIKLLTALTALALLTACGGAAAPADKTGGDTTSDDPCVTNPFGTTCTNPTETQQVTFCRDEGKTTDTKTDDCAPTVRLVCTANVFDDLCTAPTQQEAEAFCGDVSKTTATKTNDCADTITTACVDFFHTLCTADVYVQQRKDFNDMCINQAGKTKEICDAEAQVRTCAANPFMDTCLMDTVAIALRESMCLANIQIDDSCRGDTGIATVFCKADPFNTATACMADTYLPLRITNCITAGNAGESKCNNLFTESASNTCLTNPFTDACKTDGAFATYADMARTNRVSFCASNSGSLCTALTTCQGNPFHASCGAYFADAKISHCETNDVTGCPNVTNADWLASFGDTPPPATVALATANTDIRSLFLSVGTNGVIDSAGLTSAISATLSRDGDADDGVTYVIGTIESVTHSFVGLLPSTDLGAPLPSDTADATWGGSYYAGPNSGTHDITFNIDFGAGDQAGTIDATDTKLSIRTTFDLDFTATGVITGDVNFGHVDDAPDIAQARGLIGEQGLVGGFVNTDGGTYSGELYGGFVAARPAPHGTHAFWLSNARNSDDTADLRIRPAGVAIIGDPLGSLITGDTTVLDMLAGEGITVAPKYTVTLSELSDSTDTNSGFGFAFARKQNPSINSFYVGLLSGTNVGAAFTNANPPAAEWSGKISLNNFDINFFDVPITLDVVFTGGAGTIKTKPGGGVNFATDVDLTIDGQFGANGVIYGGVTYTRRYFVGEPPFPTPGSLSGLIGVNGAVAVFGNFSASNISGFGGGFVAQPTP